MYNLGFVRDCVGVSEFGYVFVYDFAEPLGLILPFSILISIIGTI